MSLHSGERQVSDTIAGIRRDHVARYEWAAKSLPAGSKVVDFACGIGYGCKVLSDAGHLAHGLDRDRESLAYANLYFATNRTYFAAADANDPVTLGAFDAAVTFETIEHIEDPRPMLRALHKSAPLMFASVPNEDVMPWRQPDGRTTAFHFRHYTRLQFAELLEECGWHPVEWYGQADHVSEVEPDVNGRTLIAICKRSEAVKEPATPKAGGKHIAILGLGPSVDQYLDLTKRLGGRSAFCDEVWAINALGNVLDCDLTFHMDDVRVQEVRAAAKPDSNIAAMLRWIRQHRGPVMTSRAHPDYPGLVQFPLAEVLTKYPLGYFNSTAAYAVAYALHVGATKITCFGMDFTYPNSHQAEKGRACVEFWLGIAAATGVELAMPKSTSLMDALYPQSQRFYGYDCVDLAITRNGAGGIDVAFTERATPTAEEMEAAYDHDRHPNAIVEAAS